MLDFQTINDAPIVIQTDNASYTYRVLSRRDLAKLSAQWFASDRATIIADAKAAGASAVEVVNLIEQRRDDARSVSWIAGRCQDLNCQADVLQAAADGGDWEPPLKPADMYRLCLAICGLLIEDDGGESGN